MPDFLGFRAIKKNQCYIARRRRENFGNLQGIFKGFTLILAPQARKFWLFTLYIQGIYIDFGAPQARKFWQFESPRSLQMDCLRILLTRGGFTRGGFTRYSRDWFLFLETFLKADKFGNL